MAKAGGPRWRRRHSPQEPVPAVGGELASGEGWLGVGARGRERSPCSPDPPLRPPWGLRQVPRASLILTLPSAQNTSLIILLMNRFAWVSLRSISAALEAPSTPFPSKEPDLWGSGPDLPLQVPGPGKGSSPVGPTATSSPANALLDPQPGCRPQTRGHRMPPEHSLRSTGEETEAQRAQGKGQRARVPPLSTPVSCPRGVGAAESPRDRLKCPGHGGRAEAVTSQGLGGHVLQGRTRGERPGWGDPASEGWAGAARQTRG